MDPMKRRRREVAAEEEEGEEGELAGTWRPRLYVNAQDPVSSAYIGFYEGEKYMPARLREAVAAPPSIGKCIQRKLGLDLQPHRVFIPRAQLFINNLPLPPPPQASQAHAMVRSLSPPSLHRPRRPSSQSLQQQRR